MSGLIALDIILSIWVIADVGLKIKSDMHQKKNNEKYRKAEKELVIAEAKALNALLYVEMHRADISNEASAKKCKDAYDNLCNTLYDFKYL